MHSFRGRMKKRDLLGNSGETCAERGEGRPLNLLTHTLSSTEAVHEVQQNNGTN
jgi:hypothetical protein